jgi:hypothetical protein
MGWVLRSLFSQPWLAYNLSSVGIRRRAYDAVAEAVKSCAPVQHNYASNWRGREFCGAMMLFLRETPGCK